MIYARVTGYLRSWQTDIGARVQPGRVLTVIDTPDLDQQFAQAKATLASAFAETGPVALKAVTATSMQIAYSAAEGALRWVVRGSLTGNSCCTPRAGTFG